MLAGNMPLYGGAINFSPIILLDLVWVGRRKAALTLLKGMQKAGRVLGLGDRNLAFFAVKFLHRGE